jgi:uncharacterized protein YraI
VEGTSSTQINVRSDPSTAGTVLGIIAPNTKVQIVGKDPGGNWWQILYEQGSDGKGWVTAQYVTTAKDINVPVIGGSSVDPNNGNVAIVQQQINIRSGPGTGFNSLGTLNAQDVVNLTGKDANGAWLQIAYTTGPEGKGWVNAAFVQARGVENLPIITEAGQVVGTGTPTGIPFTPTPTVIPAWQDNDSQNNPVANVALDPNTTRAFTYSGDISTPDGDTDDWVSFRSYGDVIWVSLVCSDTLQTQIFENGILTGMQVACGDSLKQINVKPGSTYAIHFHTGEATSVLRYISYTVKIQTQP